MTAVMSGGVSWGMGWGESREVGIWQETSVSYIRSESQHHGSSDWLLQLEVKKTRTQLSRSTQLHQVRTNWATKMCSDFYWLCYWESIPTVKNSRNLCCFRKFKRSTEDCVLTQFTFLNRLEKMASDHMTVAALGRPFTLGMLYDARKDELIPGKTWHKYNIYTLKLLEGTFMSCWFWRLL